MTDPDPSPSYSLATDGGFSVEGDENYQEEHLKQLVLCQFLIALSVVREGGKFVCKVFDLFTPFSAGLVYILYRHFDVCHVGRFRSAWMPLPAA